ncbi:MAG: DUF3631 domain-containing protein [Alphaproteobacteria bacterium]|nr:DUF3631 domain-containing protein [Alphaproteobacteria bacterium]
MTADNLTKNESAQTGTDSQKTHKDNNMKNNNSQDIPMPTLWPEPVDGMELVSALKALFERFLVLPDGASSALPFWVLHTYAMDAFYFTPRLCIYSPVPRCGKTQLLQLLEMTVYRPLNVAGITAAGVFRCIDAMHPTLLIDEADCFMNGDQTMRSVINAGYQKNGHVVRNIDTKCGYLPKRFACFSAMAIAGIGERDSTIMDRSITVVMRRKKPSDTVERLRPNALVSHTEQLRSMCMRFMRDNASVIGEINPTMPKFLHDRAKDIWEPLFAIAYLISPALVDELTYAAGCLVPKNDDAEVLEIQLLADIRDVFNNIGCDFIATKDLLGHLYRCESRPWGDRQYGHVVLTNVKLANMLHGFNIRPVQKRVGAKTARGYELAAFEDAFQCYLPDETAEYETVEAAPEMPCPVVPPCAPTVETNAEHTDKDDDQFSLCSILRKNSILNAKPVDDTNMSVEQRKIMYEKVFQEAGRIMNEMAESTAESVVPDDMPL